MRTLLLACVLVLAGTTLAQDFRAAARITNCIGFQQESLDATLLCNVSAFIEHDQLGAFLQVTPRYGPLHENWQARAYYVDPSWNLGVAARIEQVGVTVGRELGAWFIRAETDIIFAVEW